MACQRFEESTRGKTVSFEIDNTTAVTYLLKEEGTHYKDLSGLERTILLKCHKNGVFRIPQRCSNSLGRCPIQGQEGSRVELKVRNCHRLFKC